MMPFHVPDDSLVYAIGDIHGCPWLFEKTLDWITEHAAGHAYDRKLIVMLGDVVDRGPDSRATIDRILQGPPPGFRLICLRGNHEDMMLHTLESGTDLDIWLANGGRYTLQSYGLDFLDFYPVPAPADVRRMLAEAIPLSHRSFLENAPLYHQERDYLFVHAGIRPGVALEEQSKEDLLWIRHEFTESEAALGFRVVHGHSVTPEPSIRSNAIGLDTGAVMTGKLSCLALWQDQYQLFTTAGFNF